MANSSPANPGSAKKRSGAPVALLLLLLAGVFILASRQSDSGKPPGNPTAGPGTRSLTGVVPGTDSGDPPAAASAPRDGASGENLWQPAFADETAAAPASPENAPVALTEEEIAGQRMAAMEDLLPWIASAPGLDREQTDRLVRYAGQLALSDTPYLRCWSPDAPPELVAAHMMVEQRIAAAGLSLKALQVRDRWNRTATNGGGQTAQGLPVTITWSIVPDGTNIAPADVGESTSPSSLRARLAGIYGGSSTGAAASQPWFPIFQQVFDNLAAASGLRFVYEPKDDGVGINNNSTSSNWGVLGVRGDIRISGHPLDGNSGTLAYAYYPDNGDVVFDTSDSYFDTTSGNSVRLRNVLEHEIGHSLGLGHVCPVNRTKLMEPFVTTEFRGAQYDDIHSLQRNYGDRLEVHQNLRNNDVPANATVLSPTPGSLATWQWLSIDDDSDTDHFAIATSRLQTITVRVVPADGGGYLEGPQLSSGTCSDGTFFDPSREHNLVLDLLGPAGNVVATAPSQAAGVTEVINTYRFTTDGIHVIRVRGGTADRAQLYRLEVMLTDVAPASDISVTAMRLDAESNSGANGAPDPGETVRMAITLTNGGTLPIRDITASLAPFPGMTLFDAGNSYGTLEPGESAERLFTFSLPDSPAGTALQLPMDLTTSVGPVLLPVPLTLGSKKSDIVLQENFDSSPNLPDGWFTSAFGAGKKWVPSPDRYRSGPNAAFSASVTPGGESFLYPPQVTIPAAGATLEFYHSRNLQGSYDGGVLEASRANSAYFDLMEALPVTSGDYNGLLSGSSTLSGRRAWTGTARTFAPVRLEIPATWGGQTLQLRWRLAHDNSTANYGWSVDDVTLGGIRYDADTFRPLLSLTAGTTSLSEGSPGTTATITLATPLPLARDVTVTLEATGTAGPEDFVGSPDFTITLPAGSTSTTLTLAILPDSAVEGTETLELALPGDSTGFAADPTAGQVVITLEDAAGTAEVTLTGLLATYDGLPKPVTAVTDPAGLEVAITYDGSAVPPTASGSYSVVATIITPGYSGTVTGTLVILSPYGAWISAHADPSDPDAAPTGDLDGDGWSNAEEYGLGTLPRDPSSLPRLQPEVTATDLLLPLPPAPPGVLRIAETSTDLLDWTGGGIRAEGDGFAVPRDSGRRFLRLRHVVEP